MGVYVKGMEMPENCLDCPFTYFDEYGDETRKCNFTDIEALNIGIQNDCPLVEVPESHGRLIDEGEYEKNMREWHCKKCKKEKHDYNGVVCRACWVDDAIDSVSMTATVIEEEW